MFDFHFGDGLTVTSTAVQSPLVVLGQTGQGKTVFLLQFTLELIKNEQPGLLYDPYGDLAKAVQQQLSSEKAKRHCIFLTQREFLSAKKLFEQKAFVIVSGDLLEDGAVLTRAISQLVVKKAYQILKPDSWLIIDSAFGMVNNELFELYLAAKTVFRVLLSDMTLIDLSALQRRQLCARTQQYVIYKVQNIDGRWFEQLVGNPQAKDIAALPQYNFYYVQGRAATYTKALWPVQPI